MRLRPARTTYLDPEERGEAQIWEWMAEAHELRAEVTDYVCDRMEGDPSIGPPLLILAVSVGCLLMELDPAGPGLAGHQVFPVCENNFPDTHKGCTQRQLGLVTAGE